MKKKINGVISIFLIIIFVLTSCQATEKRYEIQYLNLFDTVTSIIAYTEDEETFQENVKILYEELNLYHKLYDIYKDYDGINNIKTINDNAGIKPVKVDEKIIDLLILAKEMYEKTDGKINIASGSVLSIWHQYRNEGLENPQNAKLPPMEQLKEASLHTDINQVIIDTKASTVYLEDSKMCLDVGAIGKGFATQKIGELAKSIGMTSFLISVGGNMISEGTKADGISWMVGIQNPDTESSEAYVEKIVLHGETLVTSGNYQRYYTVDGKRYHHIIDMDTLMPSDYFSSVSIITKNSGIADALSTALYNMSLEEGKLFIENIEDMEAYWILKDGTKVYTDGFLNYISK